MNEMPRQNGLIEFGVRLLVEREIEIFFADNLIKEKQDINKDYNRV